MMNAAVLSLILTLVALMVSPAADTQSLPRPRPAEVGACTPTGDGSCRFVDAVVGDDANDGSSTRPYRSLQRAAEAVRAGDVVIVRDGVYTGHAFILDINRSGAPDRWIVFRAEHDGGAVIDGRANRSATGIQVSGSYVRVQGFEVRGTHHYGIEAYRGHDVQVVNNHVHDIGRSCTSAGNGIAGINAYAPNLLIQGNVVHDVGRYAEGEYGCRATNRFWQNHDHGVYYGEGDNVVIQGNLFYNLTHGWAIHRYSGRHTAVRGLFIVNNTFVGANPYRDGQIIIASPVTDLVIANNIFFQPRRAGVWFDTDGLSGTVSNNLTFGGAISVGQTAGISFAHNLIDVDPRFVSVADRDFRLQPGSPAIGMGLRLSLPLGDAWPGVVQEPDIGAYRSR